MDVAYLLALIVAVIVTVVLIRLANKNSSKESFTGNVDHDGHTEALPVHTSSNIAPGNAEEAVRALLNSGNGFRSSWSRICFTSRKVLFGARYVSTITRTTLSALSTILGDD